MPHLPTCSFTIHTTTVGPPLGPFEPVATCNIQLLLWKTAFLMGITSAQRVGELAVLRHDPPYLRFYGVGVSISPDIRFLPKVVSSFHMGLEVSLPGMEDERHLHSRDVQRAVLFYLQQPKQPLRRGLTFPPNNSPKSLLNWLICLGNSRFQDRSEHSQLGL